MSVLIQAKQINKMLLAPVSVAGYVLAAPGTSAIVTTAITTALATATNSGGAIPLVVGSSTAQGVSTAVGRNLVPIYGATGDTPLDSNGQEVYGKITLVGADWTLSFFSVVAGVETAYSLAAGTYDFDLPVWFTFDNLPADALMGAQQKHIQPDQASQTRIQRDTLTPTGLNVLPALSQTPTGNLFVLSVNGQVFTSAAQVGTLVGTALTWVPLTAGYNVTTTDIITLIYTY